MSDQFREALEDVEDEEWAQPYILFFNNPEEIEGNSAETLSIIRNQFMELYELQRQRRELERQRSLLRERRRLLRQQAEHAAWRNRQREREREVLRRQRERNLRVEAEARARRLEAEARARNAARRIARVRQARIGRENLQYIREENRRIRLSRERRAMRRERATRRREIVRNRYRSG
jgi:membrane protein involved in colicin uptake